MTAAWFGSVGDGVTIPASGRTKIVEDRGRYPSGSPRTTGAQLATVAPNEFVANPPLVATFSFMVAVGIEELPPVFTHADVRSRGISDRQLYEWRDAARIETLGRGIFIRPGLDVDHDLLEISVRAPDATLCLASALARHQLTDDIPSVIDTALPRSLRQPRTNAPVRWQHTASTPRRSPSTDQNSKSAPDGSSASTEHSDASSTPFAADTSTAPSKPSVPYAAGSPDRGRNLRTSSKSQGPSQTPNEPSEKRSRSFCDAADASLNAHSARSIRFTKVTTPSDLRRTWNMQTSTRRPRNATGNARRRGSSTQTNYRVTTPRFAASSTGIFGPRSQLEPTELPL